jgi:malate dehydrogenase (oxaloacetate-decarboxylating)
VGGILISVAKLVLTTLCAGIHPNRTLPVVLDCGTDSEKLLNDDLYLGLRQKRVRGKRYDKFVDEFVQSARKLFPKAYIHFEDFGLTNGTPPCFSCDSGLIEPDIFDSTSDPGSLQTRDTLLQR